MVSKSPSVIPNVEVSKNLAYSLVVDNAKDELDSTYDSPC